MFLFWSAGSVQFWILSEGIPGKGIFRVGGGQELHWPHVDEVLGQGDALAVPADGDGSVQVGGGVAVLAVGDADHRAADLSETNTSQNRFPVWNSISSFKIARLSPSHLKN